jgi:hypothetical protein
MTHTPGPWTPWLAAKADGKRGKLGVWEAKTVADVEAGFGHRNLVGEASGLTEEEARLIAAAPDLLEALKQIRNMMRNKFYEDDEKIMDIEDMAAAAIAKAEGK